MQSSKLFVVLAVAIGAFALFFGTIEASGNCQLSQNCNNGTFNLLSNPWGNLACNSACQLVCGLGSSAVCQSFFSNGTELLGPNASAQPTTATCQCAPPTNKTCQPLATGNFNSALLMVFPAGWCSSCTNSTGVTNCFYDAATYRFRCDCVYAGYTACSA